MNQYPSLAGAGAGQHQLLADRGSHGLTLSIIERIKQVGDIHRGILAARRPAPEAARLNRMADASDVIFCDRGTVPNGRAGVR